MQLNQKAKARREQGLFVAEGRKMFLEAPESWVSQVFVSETVSQDGELMSQAESWCKKIPEDSKRRAQRHLYGSAHFGFHFRHDGTVWT